MARKFASVLVVALLACAQLIASQATQVPPGKDQETHETKQARPQDQNRWKWWINPDSRKEIGINDAQSAQIDKIFEEMFPPQRAKWREFQQLEPEVSKLLKERVVDVATVQQQVERMERLDAERRTMRTVMLYRMNLVLTPEQRLKLEAYNKRRDENRRKSDHR
jgi:Spy/CpxP family protein refolding chaperone